MKRRSDASYVAAWGVRVRDLTRRRLRRQSDFSLVSGLLSAVLMLTFLFDLFLGHPQIEHVPTLLWLLSFVVLALVPLEMGQRYPRWAGLVVVGYLAVWSASFVNLTFHAHTEVNALLATSIIALYLGWFYGKWVARGGLAFVLLSIFGALLFRTEPVIHSFSSPIAFAYAVMISIFCLEAGSYLRRRALTRAHFDPLTGVLNRRGLAGRAARMIAEAQRSGSPLTVAVIDFDDFKAVNDDGGHAAGDEALCATANAWVQGLGQNDVVARTGGDEFLLLINADRETANARLREIARDAPYSWTWGLTQLRSDDTLDDLMSRADGRMYDAKGQREPDLM